MSRSLQFMVPPQPPEVLGSLICSGQYVLEALNIGDPFDQSTTSSLADSPVVLHAHDPAVMYLRGVLAGLSYDPDVLSDGGLAADELTRLLAEVDNRGSITIGAA